MTEPHFRGGLPSPMSGSGRLDLSLPSMPDLDLLQYLQSLGIEDSPFNQQARPINPIRPRPTLAALRAQGGGVGLPQSLPTPMPSGGQLDLSPPSMPEIPDMTGPGPAPMPVGPSPQSPFGQGLSTEALMGGPPPAQMVTDASMGGYRPPYFGGIDRGHSTTQAAPGAPAQTGSPMIPPPAPVAPQSARSPQVPSGPPPQAMPLLPPREGLAGPVAEPPMVNHAAAASMMGAFPPAGQGINPAARAAMLQIFPPESPFGAERPVEDYFSDASLQARLQDAQRHARGQALLGFGSGMLGGEDLSSGFSAGAANISAPFARLQEQRENLPLQYALERRRLELEQSGEGRAERADERAERGTRIQESQEGREAEIHPLRMTAAEQQNTIQGRLARNAEMGGWDDQIAELERQAVVNRNDQIFQATNAIKQEIAQNARINPILVAAAIQGINESMTRGRENVARTGYYEQGGGRSSRGITGSQAMTMRNSSIKMAEEAGFTDETGEVSEDAVAAIMAIQAGDDIADILSDPAVAGNPELQSFLETLHSQLSSVRGR